MDYTEGQVKMGSARDMSVKRVICSMAGFYGA